MDALLVETFSVVNQLNIDPLLGGVSFKLQDSFLDLTLNCSLLPDVEIDVSIMRKVHMFLETLLCFRFISLKVTLLVKASR